MSILFGAAFVVALLASVALHEAGHLVSAKKFGMKASQFFVGFGPTLWSFRRGETEYGLKAIPAGGFVKILGMTQLEELDEADQPRAFWRFPAPQRTVVLSAGSAMHFVIAVVLVVGGLLLGGNLSGAAPTTTIGQVLACRNPDSAGACPAHVADSQASAAARAGLRAGDRIIAVDGRAVSSWTQFSAAVKGLGQRPATLTVVRAGVTRTIRLVPTLRLEPTGPYGALVRSAFIGVAPTTAVPAYSATGLVHASADTLGAFVTGTLSGLADLPRGIVHLFEGKPRSASSPAGVVDLTRVSGEIGAAGQETLAQRVESLLLLIADVNFFVGVFNLLPLLPLDGGHIAILAFESARSRLARLRHRADPGRVDLVKVLPVTYAVIAVFVGLSLLLIYAGFANPIRLQ